MSSEMVDAFILDSIHLAEEFHDFSMALVNGQAGPETIQAIFRLVHSMKGGSGFLIAEDARLAPFNKFCHEFENVLVAVRDGKLKPNQEIRMFIVKALDALADDLDRLSTGQEPGAHPDLEEQFARLALVSVERTNGFLLFRILRDIQMGSDADNFIAVLDKEIAQKGKKGVEIAIDLGGIHKLSSLSLGAIFGFMDEIEKVVFLRPPAIMEKLVTRFALGKEGVEIRQAL